MIGLTIPHYKILEKPPNSSGQVREVRKFLPQFPGGTGIFRIPPVCGGSGMGVVYKAQDLKLERLVALKLLPGFLTSLAFFLFSLFLFTPLSLFAQGNGNFFLSADSLKKNGSIYLAGAFWKYHAGDDSLWASPAFDDSDWMGMKPTMDLDSIPKGTWTGIGWFRLHFAVDSALRNKTLAMMMGHDGASEIYLDGMLVHRFGTVSGSEKQEKIYAADWSPIGLHLDGKAKHLLAVRYSFLNAEKIKSRYGFWAGWSGFSMWVEELNSKIDNYVDDLRINLIYGMFPLGLLGLLSFLHFMLFAFYAKEKSNLYFAVFAAAYACAFFFNWLPTYAHLDVELWIWTLFLSFGSSSLAATFGLMWGYSVFYSRIQKQIWVIVLAAVLLCVINIWRPEWGRIANLLFLGGVLLEVLRVIGGAILKKHDGAWIIGAGGVVTILAIFIGMIQFSFLMFTSSHWQLIRFFIICGQQLPIPIAMSMFLARRSAKTNVTLAAKLVETQELSKRMLEQEMEKKKLIEAQKDQLEIEVAERTKELRMEKEETERLLYNILPVEIAKELQEKGTIIPRRYEEISVLFSDFKGFTNTVSTMPANRLVEELNDIFHVFDDIIDKHGIEKIKTIGDSYLIAAGLPKESENHAIQCVKVALEMIHFIEKRNETSAIKWQMRVGIHSGTVVAGVVGKKKFTYDVWGDTVNIAQRMEASGVPGKVNISAYTYDLIKQYFECEYRGKVDAKGKGEIDMYFVKAEINASDK